DAEVRRSGRAHGIAAGLASPRSLTRLAVRDLEWRRPAVEEPRGASAGLLDRPTRRPASRADCLRGVLASGARSRGTGCGRPVAGRRGGAYVIPPARRDERSSHAVVARRTAVRNPYRR